MIDNIILIIHFFFLLNFQFVPTLNFHFITSKKPNIKLITDDITKIIEYMLISFFFNQFFNNTNEPIELSIS